MQVDELAKHKRENNFEQFYNAIKNFVPQLKHYVRQKLHIAEKQGKIMKGFYKPDDIIDEVYAEIYREFDPQWDEHKLKVELFRLVKKKLDEIIDKQPQIEKYSIEQIMEQELATLEERLTVTADGELMLEDELDSADYQYLKQTPECIIIDQSIEQKVLELLDKPQKKELADNEQKAFWRLYRVLPTQSKAVVELYVFGGLTRAEVADIMHIAEYQVDAVLNNFTQNLRKLPK